jgi:flagellar M-ring protein FliF
MLERSLGPGHVRAEAAVEMNFEHIKETTENYNPDQQVVRSTQSVNDTNKSTEGEKTVSVQNNLPNADAGAAGGQTGSSDQRSEETTNYEIGKVVRTLVREQPQIARISLAVMVDGTMLPGADGKVAWHERDADDLARIKRLVQSAVGYDAKRGDTVEVVSMRFVQTDDGGGDVSKGLLGLGLEKNDVMGLGQTAILGLVILLALLFVLRPLALRLSDSGLLSGGEDAPLMLADGTVAYPGGGLAGSGMPAMAGAAANAMLADESMLEMANIEGQIRASSIRKLAELVEKHPDESLTIMRSWMNEERA